MIFTIKDFILPSIIIEKACKSKNDNMVNLELIFHKDENIIPYLNKDGININKTSSLSATYNAIINVYLNNYKYIHGKDFFTNEEERKKINISIANFISFLSKEDIVKEDIASCSIYTYPFIYILLKDIILPYFGKELKNYKVFLTNASYVDVANPVFKEDKYLVCNYTMNYKPYYYANMLISIIKLHEMDHSGVIKECLNSKLLDKINGLCKLNFNKKEEIDDFLMFLKIICGIEENNIEKIIIERTKIAQYESALSSPWWYSGLIEKMLGPAREPDTSGSDKLYSFTKNFLDKVERYKKKNNLSGITTEMLLRLKSGENKKEDLDILEKIIAKNRIWE